MLHQDLPKGVCIWKSKSSRPNLWTRWYIYLEGTFPINVVNMLSLILRKYLHKHDCLKWIVTQLTPWMTERRHKCQVRVHRPKNGSATFSRWFPFHINHRNAQMYLERWAYLPGTPCNKYPLRKGIPRHVIKDESTGSTKGTNLTSFSIPAGSADIRIHIHLWITQSTCHSSEARKSLQSARIISLTPGWRTMELIGRFWRAPFHRQIPYDLIRSSTIFSGP